MEFKDEEFKECPEYTSLEVSQYGNVRKKDGTILEPTEENKYLYVEYPKGKKLLVHRLVALTWLIEKRKHKDDIVHHKDENKLNNQASNLCWMNGDIHRAIHGIVAPDENTILAINEYAQCKDT